LQNLNNNDNEFDEFVESTKRGLAGYIARFVSSPDDIQGLMQDAYLKVFITLSKEREAGHSPQALLYTTARNLAISRLRHEKVIRHSFTAVSVAEELRGERSSAEQAVAKSQKLKELMLIVSSLPPKCREVFVLRWIHGLSQRAISERLGIAVSTVEKHLAKGLRVCKDEIRQKSESEDAEVELPVSRSDVGVAS
jgi:RNA polymerase sigma-70 factor (ECF subfamily)